MTPAYLFKGPQWWEQARVIADMVNLLCVIRIRSLTDEHRRYQYNDVIYLMTYIARDQDADILQE